MIQSGDWRGARDPAGNSLMQNIENLKSRKNAVPVWYRPNQPGPDQDRPKLHWNRWEPDTRAVDTRFHRPSVLYPNQYRNSGRVLLFTKGLHCC